MKGKVILRFICAVLCFTCICGVADMQALNLRLMSYNIRNTTGLDGKMEPERIASVIERIFPDAVAIQEVDSVTGRSRGRNLLAEIAGHAGMYHIYAPAIDYDNGKYGIGILCRTKPIREVRVPLPGREEHRVLLAVEFHDYVFASTHLSLNEQDRLSSLSIIDSVASIFEKPFIIAGDFNANLKDNFMQEFLKEFSILSTTKELSFPADNPSELIDYIFVKKDKHRVPTVKTSRVVNEPVASDHRPVYADIIIGERPDNIISVDPYIQNPTDGAMTVLWQTKVPATGIVEFGTSPDNMNRVRTLLDGQAYWGTMHRVRLNGLEDGKKYYYRVISREILEFGPYNKIFGDSIASDLKSFTYHGKDSEDFTAVIFNDLHKHSNTFSKLRKQIKGIEYDFVVFNGDCIDDPYNHSQATRFLKELNEGVGAGNVPAFYIRGNHEIRGAYSVGLRELFDYPEGKTYYSFSWGDTRFVVLDCGEDKPDNTSVYFGLNDFTSLRKEQAQFLKKELKSKEFKKAKKRILIHHAPVYGLEVDYTDYNPCLEMWGPILDKAPFDLAINAHTHRFTFHPKGKIGNNYPVVVGGGFGPEDATVMILNRRDGMLNLKVLNTAGETLLKKRL